jgi:threonine/homoserine/homoserine lactone efflux protein
VVAFSGAASPGPLLAVAIVEGNRRGFLAGPLLIVGHGILELLMLFLLVLGLDKLLAKPFVEDIISLVGGAFLLYMGVGISRSSFEEKSMDEEEGGGNTLFLGALVSLSNPYWTIWWITVGVAILSKSLPFGLLGVALFFTGHILADFLWYSGVTLAVSQGKNFLTPRFYQFLMFFCGLLLLVMSLYFMYSGFKGIL